MKPSLKPSHAVVGGWAAGNVVLALVLLGFGPFEFSTGALPFLLYIAATVIVASFGLAVLVAVRSGRVGAQRRQPRRASAAVFAVLGLAVALTAFSYGPYGWWLALLGLYPLGLAAWLVRGERLRPGARPWPVAPDLAEPAGPARLVHDGSSVGVAVAVPAEHAAHGPPPQPSRRLRTAVRSGGLLIAVGRAAVDLLRGRRR